MYPGLVISLFVPSGKKVPAKKVAVAKKTDAVTADAVTEEAEKVKDAPIAGEKKESVASEGVKTRAGKGKAVPQ